MQLPDTLILQRRLTTAGFSVGPHDGDFGPQTMAAVCELISGKGQIPIGTPAHLWSAMQGRGITKPLRIVHFLANVGHECRFKPIDESLSYTAGRLMQVWPGRFPDLASTRGFANNPRYLANYVYANRMGNGPPASGDGYRFRGRGFAQLTGRDAYGEIGEKIGVDLVANPDLVLIPAIAADAAAAFWEWKSLAPLADNNLIRQLRRRWNGGEHGLAEVAYDISRLISLWGIAP